MLTPQEKIKLLTESRDSLDEARDKLTVLQRFHRPLWQILEIEGLTYSVERYLERIDDDLGLAQLNINNILEPEIPSHALEEGEKN